MPEHRSPCTRRDFLGTASLTLTATALAKAFPAAAASCGVTTQTTAGPFYVSNAPRVMKINRLNAPGMPMRIGGRVLGGPDGRRPLAGTTVEIWHCDDLGRYHPPEHGDMSAYPPEAINLRSLMQTDRSGGFAFLSIVPGHYGARRRHIHWKFTARDHRPLTTQSYWANEKGSARERFDPVDPHTEACRWVLFEPGPDGIITGRFDVVLAPLD